MFTSTCPIPHEIKLDLSALSLQLPPFTPCPLSAAYQAILRLPIVPARPRPSLSLVILATVVSRRELAGRPFLLCSSALTPRSATPTRMNSSRQSQSKVVKAHPFRVLQMSFNCPCSAPLPLASLPAHPQLLQTIFHSLFHSI